MENLRQKEPERLAEVVLKQRLISEHLEDAGSSNNGRVDNPTSKNKDGRNIQQEWTAYANGIRDQLRAILAGGHHL